MVCPMCGYGGLRKRGFNSRWAECESCCCALDRITVGRIEQIVALPDALDEHAFEECGHPEMRSLPDGTFHCPACESEVVPAGSNLCAVVSHAVDGEQRRGAATTGRERGAEQGYSKTIAKSIARGRADVGQTERSDGKAV